MLCLLPEVHLASSIDRRVLLGSRSIPMAHVVASLCTCRLCHLSGPSPMICLPLSHMLLHGKENLHEKYVWIKFSKKNGQAATVRLRTWWDKHTGKRFAYTKLSLFIPPLFYAMLVFSYLPCPFFFSTFVSTQISSPLVITFPASVQPFKNYFQYYHLGNVGFK